MSSSQKSELQIERAKFRPVLPSLLRGGPTGVVIRLEEAGEKAETDAVRGFFPNTCGAPLVGLVKGKNPALRKKSARVGVVLSGGQAPGGHNVIAGLFDALRMANRKNTLLGFRGGPSGILNNEFKVLTMPVVDPFRNTGGFDIIQSGRTKIETPEQFEKAKDTMLKNRLNALVVIGGDDSNTDAAFLAEYFKARNAGACVIGVPKTIDGDLKNEHIEASFGFDTATKIYAELVGNICRDVNSARKYWHFIRLMGRSASHITLEVAFKTRPNVAWVGEEVLAKKMTLAQVVDAIAGVVVRRAEQKKDFGVVLIPEGLIEFIPEFKELMANLNDILAAAADKPGAPETLLPDDLRALMNSLPAEFKNQLMLDRDPHGNVKVSQIETERLLVEMVKRRLSGMRKAGTYAGKFAAITHFFGYEGRCGAPSNFDANYGYALGCNAAALALNGLTGYLSSVRGLAKPPAQWRCGGVPLTMLMNIERRKGKEKPVIQKALVELDGAPFRTFEKDREDWALNDRYVFPGPIQFFGPPAVTDLTTKTLQYEQRQKGK